MDKEDSGKLSWKKSAIKQGYLIRFHRGLLKAPKMQYFVLTASGLVAFNGRPDEDSEPLVFLPFDELKTIKVDELELNSCKLSCMQITSKTASSLLLAFSRKEERDDWMMATMTAFSEALVSTQGSKTSEANKPTPGDGVGVAVTHFRNVATSISGQTLRRKRRKGTHGSSIRRSKSCDALRLNDCTNNANLTTVMERTHLELPRLEDSKLCQISNRKRKSEPEINVVSHFPSAWDSHDQNPEFKNNCFEHRDSLTLLASKQCSKCELKTGIFSKILSKFELPTKPVQTKSKDKENVIIIR